MATFPFYINGQGAEMDISTFSSSKHGDEMGASLFSLKRHSHGLVTLPTSPKRDGDGNRSINSKEENAMGCTLLRSIENGDGGGMDKVPFSLKQSPGWQAL